MTEPTDLGGTLHAWANRFADRPAVIDADATLTFSALDRAADDWAAALVGAGCAGRHVGLLGANGAAWLAAAFGVWRAGATLVPISTFVTARELGEILEDAELAALIMQPRLHSHDYAAMLQAQPPSQRPQHQFPLGVEAPRAGAPAVSEASAPNREVDPEAIAAILYTSGTTGRAKGVMLSHRAILATMAPTAERGGLGPDDVLLSTLPLFWVAGLVIRALPTLASGCALILIERFTPELVLATLRRHRPTALHLRPPQIGQLLSHPDFDPALLARVRRGGGRIEWFHPYLDAGSTWLITGYGMTETAGYVTALDCRDSPEVRRTAIGSPLPGVEIHIMDAAGHRCGPGITGEVRVRAPGLFSGYHRQPAGTALDADGFLRTGDLGHIDAAGQFHFSGRSKDLLRVKGINVSPAEVESVLASHPAVDAAYVVGLPPDALEQEIVALITTRGDVPLPEVELRALATDALSHYKRPTRYVSLRQGDVPLSGTAKPVRGRLAELAARRVGSDLD